MLHSRLTATAIRICLIHVGTNLVILLGELLLPVHTNCYPTQHNYHIQARNFKLEDIIIQRLSTQHTARPLVSRVVATLTSPS